jgi:hypothetical protein
MSKKKVDYIDIHDSIDWNEFESKFLSDPEVKAACDLIQRRLESMLPKSVQELDEEDAADFWILRADIMQDFGPDKDEINVFHVACFQQS